MWLFVESWHNKNQRENININTIRATCIRTRPPWEHILKWKETARNRLAGLAARVRQDAQENEWVSAWNVMAHTHMHTWHGNGKGIRARVGTCTSAASSEYPFRSLKTLCLCVYKREDTRCVGPYNIHNYTYTLSLSIPTIYQPTTYYVGYTTVTWIHWKTHSHKHSRLTDTFRFHFFLSFL